jgi:hypothetical protein
MMIQNKQDTPVFITGVERSGSSIIARIIGLCGAFTGEVSHMQENLLIKLFVSKYYKIIGRDIRGQYPLPDTNEMIIPSDWKAKIIDILKQEDYKTDQLWMYKESRLCQIWPVWNYAFPNAKWIIVRRRTGDIIESCLKTGYMNGYSTREGWLDWVHHHEKLFVEMIETGLNCKIVWPERMVSGDYAQMEEMIDWLGLKWNDEIVSLIEPMLYNSKQKIKEV